MDMDPLLDVDVEDDPDVDAADDGCAGEIISLILGYKPSKSELSITGAVISLLSCEPPSTIIMPRLTTPSPPTLPLPLPLPIEPALLPLPLPTPVLVALPAPAPKDCNIASKEAAEARRLNFIRLDDVAVGDSTVLLGDIRPITGPGVPCAFQPAAAAAFTSVRAS